MTREEEKRAAQAAAKAYDEKMNAMTDEEKKEMKMKGICEIVEKNTELDRKEREIFKKIWS